MNSDSIKADIISITWNSLYILANANSEDGEYELPPAFISRYYRIFNELGELQDELKAMITASQDSQDES